MEGKEGYDLRIRTRQYALAIIRFYSALPKTTEAQVIGKQLLRSGTSVGAHYREACRAKSDAEFVNKIEGGLQELDETSYWLELLNEIASTPNDKLHSLLNESNELIAIFVTMVKKIKNKASRP